MIGFDLGQYGEGAPAVLLPVQGIPDNLPGSLGRSQVVRQRILIPPYGGSNPPAPANPFNYLKMNIVRRYPVPGITGVSWKRKSRLDRVWRTPKPQLGTGRRDRWPL
jgi:hypothetical protein